MDKVNTAPVEAIYGKMAAIFQDIDAIGKNARNATQGFNYRGIDDVYNALNPILAKHGVFMTAEIIAKDRQERTNSKGTVLAFTTLRMRYSFWADDGSHVETEAEGEGMDSGDKSSNKAMAVAHKYALLQAFCIPTKDLDDPDAESHEVAAPGRAHQESARAPEQPRTTQNEATPPSSDRSAKARVWAEEAMRYIHTVGDSKKFEAWNTRMATTIAEVETLAPETHKKLMAAIDTRRAQFHPLSA